MAAGLALVYRNPGPGAPANKIAVGASLFTLLVAGLTLLQYGFGFDFGIDQLLFEERQVGIYPGRMSPATAAAFVTSALALQLKPAQKFNFSLQCVCWASVLTISLAALMLYFAGSSKLHQIGPYASMALHSAAGLAVLAIGGMAQCWPEGRFSRLFATGGAAKDPSLYVMVGALVLLMAWIEYVLILIFDFPSPYALFYPVIMFAALTGGLWAGVFATVLAAIMANLYVIQPIGHFDTSAGNLLGLGAFCAIGLLISLIVRRLHLLYAEIVTANATLEQRVKERTAELARSLERLEATEHATGALVYDSAGGKVWRSGGLTQILGWRQEDVPPTFEGWQELCHPDDVGALQEFRSKPILDAEGRYAAEYRARHKDGHYVWLMDRGRMVSNEHGNLSRVIGASFDVTELKRTEAKLAESQEQMRLAFDAAKIVAWRFDAVTGELTLTPNAAKVLELPAGVALANSTDGLQFIHPDDREKNWLWSTKPSSQAAATTIIFV